MARDRISAIAENADGLEEIFPAYVALATWGENGFEEITRIALAGETVKIVSAALTVLSSIVEHGRILGTVFVEQNILNIANERISIQDCLSARHALTAMVMAIPTEDLMLPLSQSFMHYALGAMEAPKILSLVISSKWMKFGPAVLDRFEQMLITHADDEPAFQAFFCVYPQMLDPMAVKVWSQADLHGAVEPDFVLQRVDDSYLVVEIETPGKLLMTQDGQLASGATHAEKQVNDYCAFLNERSIEARHLFPNYRSADKMAVIGLHSRLNPQQIRALSILNETRHKLVTVGFDWLLDRARRVLQNLSEGEIQVLERQRMI